MKLLHEFFPTIDTFTVAKQLKKSGITIEDPDRHRFSNVSVVIGPNGAGKTRFLEALRDLYVMEPSADVLYCYFPDLSARKFVKRAGSPRPRYTLKNFLDRDGISFDNFVKAIEEQGESFLLGLLQGESDYDLEENTSRLERMESFASSFLDKNIVRGFVRAEKGSEKGRTIVVKKASGNKTLPLSEALEKFSPGERLLFYMALFLTLKKETRHGMKQCIILDEPETHLHPDALLKFANALQTEFPDADIWIATHSLFLIPKFKFENIVYIENSQIVRRNSKVYEKVISGMLGEGNEAVEQFFASRAQWQYYEYISECFTAPKVVDTVDPNDPQVKTFLQTDEKREIKKVLDFGGGSGRLGRSVEAAHLPQWKDTVYHIVDKDPALTAVKDFTVFTKLKDADKDYDCIVMMNVLHEIEPDEWVSLFHELRDHLTEKGELLIIEVAALRDGECPNETGYILLGEPELAILFGCEEGFVTISGSPTYPFADGFCLNRYNLSAVSTTTVTAAIKGLESRTYQAIKDMRSNKEKTVNTREYAFLLQQYINAKLFNERQAERSSAPSQM